jgi:hypothetical protein
VYGRLGFIYLVLVIPLQRVMEIIVSRQLWRKLTQLDPKYGVMIDKPMTFSVSGLGAVYRYFKRGTRKYVAYATAAPASKGRRFSGLFIWLRGVWQGIKGFFKILGLLLRLHVFGVMLSKVLLAMIWPLAAAFSVFWLNQDAIEGVGSDQKHKPWWGPDRVAPEDETQVADKIVNRWLKPETV